MRPAQGSHTIDTRRKDRQTADFCPGKFDQILPVIVFQLVSRLLSTRRHFSMLPIVASPSPSLSPSNYTLVSYHLWSTSFRRRQSHIPGQPPNTHFFLFPGPAEKMLHQEHSLQAIRFSNLAVRKLQQPIADISSVRSRRSPFLFCYRFLIVLLSSKPHVLDQTRLALLFLTQCLQICAYFFPTNFPSKCLASSLLVFI